MKRAMIRLLAGVGGLGLLLLMIGVANDVRGVDQTRGGYQPPYGDYVGKPIDWDSLARGPEGFILRGRVMDVLLDCDNGMLSLFLFGWEFAWRRVSERALVVHRPREACQRHGYATRF